MMMSLTMTMTMMILFPYLAMAKELSNSSYPIELVRSASITGMPPAESGIDIPVYHTSTPLVTLSTAELRNIQHRIAQYCI